MPAISVVRAVANTDYGPGDVDDVQARLRLKPYGLHVRKLSLPSVSLEEMCKNAIFVERKKGNLLVVPIKKIEELLGRRHRKESVMSMTALRAGGMTFDDIFAKRILDDFRILYYKKEIAVVMPASRLIEQLS